MMANIERLHFKISGYAPEIVTFETNLVRTNFMSDDIIILSYYSSKMVEIYLPSSPGLGQD